MRTMTLIKAIALAAAFGTTAAAASAQTSRSIPGARSQGAAQAVTVTNVLPARASDTMVGYRNADPLHGIYAQGPVFAQCGDHTVVGPMSVAEAGSLAAQPLYNFMIDSGIPGEACRKAL
jgi:hypothetical protein